MRQGRWLAGVALITLMTGCGPPSSGGDDDDVPAVDGSFNGCASATYDAVQVPAAMLVVLDRSSSMAMNSKWTFAAQAIVQALDADSFDGMHVGLYAAPSGSQAGPSCLLGLPVSCQAPPFPQVDLALAGADKSSAASGVRRRIKDWLTANSPDNGLGDASPMHAALTAANASLTAWPMAGKRIILAVTDGALSCNQFSTRPGYPDCNGCNHDWENPQNIVDLVAAAYMDGAKPIETFVVGVPGADTFDSTGCNFPPYRMRQALSAIAWAGSPTHVPAACTGRAYMQSGADPATSCHFDMTQGGFTAQRLADAIAAVRGAAVGCILELPRPPDGSSIDRSRVNVRVIADSVTSELAKRQSMTNQCLTTGCWDYTSDGKVELIGKACDDVRAARSIQVKVETGCTTRVL